MNSRIRQILVLALAALFLLTFIPQEASAFPYRVEGYLKDSEGNPITLADIQLSGQVYDMDIQDYAELVQTTETDSHGYFRFDVGVAPTTPDGYIPPVTVSYEASGHKVSKSLDLEGTNAWVNLTYEKPATGIDIIFSPAGLLIIVTLICVIFISYYMSKTDKDSEEKGSRDVSRRRR